jgi:hypothetical protein
MGFHHSVLTSAMLELETRMKRKGKNKGMAFL